MQTTSTTLFGKARVCVAFMLTFLLLIIFIPFTTQAQQNPSTSGYPFSLDFNLGGGLIGNPSLSSAFQPELGLSYMPGRLGLGLNAGFLSYNPTFDSGQYTSGFEDITSVTKSGEKWTSFYVGIGPRFEFGSLSHLPLTFRGSLDLAMSYNAPPESLVDFNDPTGSTGDAQLQLAGFKPGDGYSKWSAALRPEFQIQFSPGGSDRFAINLTTGIQHRLTENNFTYTRKDLSQVRRSDNPAEMFFQFESAPDIQQSAGPPQTNFFSSVGIKIKFGKPQSRSGHLHKEGVVHRDIASRNVAAGQNGSGSGDCDDGDPCVRPGEKAAPAQDYNSSRSNKPRTRAADGGGDCDDGDPCVRPDGKVAPAQDYNSSRSNRPRTRAADSGGGGVGPIRWMAPESIIAAGPVAAGSAGNNPLYEEERRGENPLYEGESGNNTNNDTDTEAVGGSSQYRLAPASSCLIMNPAKSLGTSTDTGKPATRVMEATDYNSSRSNTEGIANPDTGGDTDSDINSPDTKASEATDYNSSRSNTEGVANPDTGGGNGSGSDSTIVSATDYNSSRSNTEGIANPDTGGDNGFDADSPDTKTSEATDYNSSRSNTEGVANPDTGGDGDGDGDGNRGQLKSAATSHNASRSNRSQGIMNDGTDTGDLNAEGDSTRVSPATSHNASRSNRSSGIMNDGTDTGDLDAEGDSKLDAPATSHNASRSNRSQGIMNDGTDTGDLDAEGDSTLAAPATSHNASRSNRSQGGLMDDGFGGDLDGDGFPDIMKDASMSISKRSARTQRTQNKGGDEGAGAARYNFKLEFNDPDSDDDGLMDAVEASTFSISRPSQGPGTREGNPLYSENGSTGNNPMYEENESVGAANNGGNNGTAAGPVKIWTYDLSSLSNSGGGDPDADADGLGDGVLLDGATLRVIHQNGSWHYDIQLDPDLDLDTDQDGYGEALRNSSFSISKRSARTGR